MLTKKQLQIFSIVILLLIAGCSSPPPAAKISNDTLNISEPTEKTTQEKTPTSSEITNGYSIKVEFQSVKGVVRLIEMKNSQDKHS